MSVPDHELEEESDDELCKTRFTVWLDEPSDEEWCFCHEEYRPCKECGDMATERRIKTNKGE